MGIFSRIFNRGEDEADAPDTSAAQQEDTPPGGQPEPNPDNLKPPNRNPAQPPEGPHAESDAEDVEPESVEPPTARPAPGKRPSKRAPPPPRQRKPRATPPESAPGRRSKKPASLPPLELGDLGFAPKPKQEPESIPKVTPLSRPSEFEEALLAEWGVPPAERQELPPDDDPLGDIASELDARFDASRRRSDLPITAVADSTNDAVTTADDLGAVRQLFNEMAVPFMSQVRDFMLELRHTSASTSWIDLCEPALQSLRATCEPLDMPDLARSLDDYVALLAEAKTAPSGRVDGEIRQRLLDCYQQMTAQLPEAFEVGAGREPVIVQLLLSQVVGVHKLTIEKLYRAGVHHFEAFLNAKADELAAVAGIELELAQRIIDKFLDYRRRVHSVVTQFMPGEEHDHLSELAQRLREQESGYERASAGWSAEAKADKRRLRRERAQTLSEVYVALARLGEVQRIDALQKLPVLRQIEELERFLRATQKS